MSTSSQQPESPEKQTEIPPQNVSRATQTTAQAISEFKSKSGLKRIFSAFFYSLDGLQAAWRQEHAFRQELILVVIGSIIALLLPVSAFEKLLMIAVLVLMLIVELLNSAIEAVVDRVSLERHALSKNAKDFGSAAVLLTFLLAAATWAVILVDRFYY
ncbi:diacylglycerol kinase [Undibacterium baiyunense]|uniref:Diacylglycerol kinase n=1 Tax=Undibacterium baiyunense TaxID=2828731 RepID=A0A941DEK9_9BURK|nr:diacylglycerol kinase [Undibacterium baiyunense]MBR7747324.1 diacylglycerol kinase [Undibacterium baiyunense]